MDLSPQRLVGPIACESCCSTLQPRHTLYTGRGRRARPQCSPDCSKVRARLVFSKTNLLRSLRVAYIWNQCLQRLASSDLNLVFQEPKTYTGRSIIHTHDNECIKRREIAVHIHPGFIPFLQLNRCHSTLRFLLASPTYDVVPLFRRR